MSTRSVVVWISLGTLAVLGLTLGAYVAPWVSPPPESAELIATRWTSVQGWATTSPDSAAAPTRLQPALQHLKAAGDLRQLLERSGPPRYERIPLSDEAQAAVAELRAWSDSASGLGEDLCLNAAQPEPPGLPAHHLWQLGQLAIRAAPSVSDPALAAALRLAAQLRQRGGLLHARIGFSMADEAVQTAQARGWPASEAFERYRPQTSEVFAVLARESVCSVRLVEHAFSGTASDGELAPRRSFWTSRLQRFVGSERELQMAKWFMGVRLAEAFPAREDLTALGQVLAAADTRPRPPSAVLEALAVDWGPHLKKMRSQLETYDRFLGRTPIPAPAPGP